MTTTEYDGIAMFMYAMHDGAQIAEGRAGGGADAFVFGPDSRLILAAMGPVVRVWDASPQDQSLRTVGAFVGHTDTITSVEFSVNGDRVLTASLDRTVRLWDAASARQITSLPPHETWVLAASFSPDARRIVTASGSRAYVWEVGRLVDSTERLVHDACLNYLSAFAGERTFSAAEVDADPLIAELWLQQDRDASSDICDGVPGLVPLAPALERDRPAGS